VFSAVFALLDPQVQVTYVAKEGSWGERRTVAELEGPLRPILMGERTALNFLQRLSGIATTSRQAAELVTGTDVLILDTRKTTPGLRTLEKYAVRVGGCHNHRGGLDDGVLIKENHIRAAGGIAEAIAAARKRVAPIQRIEVEVTNLAELEQAIDAEADIVLYDNGSVEELRAAVSFAAGRVRIEASGGITLANLREVAATGVDYISLGALTHSAGVIDFSLEVS
jgi:nicotinate-nucleotide pyrophosphorylase (carboxylating)